MQLVHLNEKNHNYSQSLKFLNELEILITG